MTACYIVINKAKLSLKAKKGINMNAIDKYRSMQDEKEKSDYMFKCLRFMNHNLACTVEKIFPIIHKENHLAAYCAIYHYINNEPYIVDSEEDFRNIFKEEKKS